MASAAPVVYIFNGDDEFAIDQAVAELKAKLGDSPNAAMNFSELDGRSVSYDELSTAASTMPFLADRRVVVLTYPLERFGKEPERGKLVRLLEGLPETAALALVEYRPLTSWKDRRDNKIHWLEAWALEAKDRVYFKTCSLPKGEGMVRWIVTRARDKGGSISNKGAEGLANLVGSDTRTADHELDKLLLYVDYKRPVEIDDVLALTAYEGEGDIFGLVDALGERDGRTAIKKLHELLGDRDPLSILGMIVRQFRLLIQAREILDQGYEENEVIKRIKVYKRVGEKITAQARKFDLQTLESIYRRLLEVDLAIKSSEMEGDQILDVFIAEQM